jgi:hypothetical protein
MIYFKTRTIAREFAKKHEHYSVVDCVDNLSAGKGYRWAVKVI